MKKRILEYSILILLFALLALYPFAFELKLANSNFERFDITLMVSPYAWILLLVLCSLLSLHVLLSGKLGILHLFVVALLIYGLFTLTLYLTGLRFDDWVHAGGVRQVVLQGTIDVSNGYVRSWPGFFILWSSLSQVTSLNTLIANRMLTFLSMGLSVALLYILGRNFLGAKWAALPGLLYLVSDVYAFQYLDRLRFTPFVFAFLLFLIFLYVLIKYPRLSNRSWFAVLVPTIGVIILSHVLVPLFIVIILFVLAATSKLTKIQASNLLRIMLLTIAMWIPWWLSHSTDTLEQAFSFISSFFRAHGSAKISGIARVPGLSMNFGTFLSNYYFRGVLVGVVLISMAALFVNRKERGISLHVGLVFSAVIFATLVLLAPVTDTNIQWARVLPLFLVPIAYVASSILTRKDHRARISAILLIFLIIPSFLASFSFLSLYVEATHPWEVQCFQFLSNKTASPISMETDHFTAQTYGMYFDVNNRAQISEIPLSTLNLTDRLAKTPTFFYGNTVVRSFRQELVQNNFLPINQTQEFWSKVDNQLNQYPLMKRVYDNGKMQVYRNP